MKRRSRVFLVIGACVAVVAVGATATLFAVDRVPRRAALGIDGRFTLATTDGRTVSDRTWRGKWLVVYFGYTFCPDACPTALNSIGSALDALGPLAAEVQPLFITIDPARDTPQAMAEYMSSFDPRLVGLVGTPEQVAAATKDYRVYYAVRALGGGEYAVDHSSFIYVVDPRGAFAKLLTGDLPGHKLADELRRLIERSGGPSG
jgi:protein SCO1